MKFFYEYFRPIAICFKVLGLLPLENILDKNPSRIRFRAISYSFFYATAGFGVTVGLLFYFVGNIFTSNSPLIMKIVICGMGVRSFACFFLYSFASYYELPKLIQLLDTFDRKKVDIIQRKQAEWKVLLKWTIIPIIFMLLALVVYLINSAQIISSVYVDIADKDSKYVFSFLVNWQLFPTFLYLYFAGKIQEGFSEINNALLDTINCFKYTDKNGPKCPTEICNAISNIRILHNILHDGTYQIGKTFGLYVAIDKLTIILVLIINIAIYVKMNDHNKSLFYVTLLNGTFVSLIIWTSQKVKENGIYIVNLLRGIPNHALTDETRAEILLILTELAARPVFISADGFFKMDKRQLMSITSSVATYLIVLFQTLDNYPEITRNTTNIDIDV